MKILLALFTISATLTATVFAEEKIVIESFTQRNQPPVTLQHRIDTTMSYKVMSYFPDEPPVVPHPGVAPIVYETTTTIENASADTATQPTQQQ